MKNEIRIVSESERFKTEELENAEREIIKMKEEIKFFQDSNKELVNSIDEVERTLQELESSHVHVSHDGSYSDNSHLKLSKRALMDENEKLVRDLAQYEAKNRELQVKLE
jgi:predicted RNase H-like nuclease (RuvC/YqgF family)